MLVRVVDNCPKCGSNKTGYFIRTEVDYGLKTEKFKRGERIRFLPIDGNSYKNTFCCDCKNKWHSTVKLKIMGRKSFNQHLIDKGFIEQRDNYKLEKLSDEEIAKLKQMRKEHGWDVFASVFSFVTGIRIVRKNPYTLKRIKDEIMNDEDLDRDNTEKDEDF